MEKFIKFFKENFDSKVIVKNIRVYGWQDEYDHLLISSCCKYLFEDLDIIENIAPLTNDNREGRVRPNYFITVHDTGDSSSLHTAKFWSETVKVQDWELGHYGASYQYVTGNDGIYHNIPDEEVAYHAGDGTRVVYALNITDMEGNDENPEVTIIDGYYAINGKKTIVEAPRIYKEKNGEVVLDRVPETSDINDGGVLCVLKNGKYYIGETYFSSTYEKICNRGGNNNSIGIESCINKESDIYLTWQRTAKLVAKLLDENNLLVKDVKQHHYFSGKNCPQTMRMNNMWNHFLSLVQFEYDLLKYKKLGYHLELIKEDNRILDNGRIMLTEKNENEIKFKIKFIKENDKKREEFIEEFILNL